MHHQNKPTPLANNLSAHASLLLSASPTIIHSPLQSNTNNTTSYSDDELPDDNINFKKPQNEIFKKLDGKIQKIVAAHSNLNKLYALNDFSGAGPKKPFELPPQLPRPPPWVPKVSSDYVCSQWAEDSTNNLNSRTLNQQLPQFRQSSSILGSTKVTKITSNHDPKGNPLVSKRPTLSIDSAILKLHQRRQQQTKQTQQKPQNSTQSSMSEQLLQQIQKLAQRSTQHDANTTRDPFPGPSRPGDFAQVDYTKRPISIIPVPPNQTSIEKTDSIRTNLTPDERRKFQMELINMFRQEIAAVTKLAKLKFSPQNDKRPKTFDQKSLLLKKSPQSIYNTIRRETSLLLNRKEPINRSGSSLLTTKHPRNSLEPNWNAAVNIPVDRLRQIVSRYHTIKVVIPPTEFHKHSCIEANKTMSENLVCRCYESSQSKDIDQRCPTKSFTVEYDTLRKKLSRYRLGIQLESEQAKKRLATFDSFKRALDRHSTWNQSLNRGQIPEPLLPESRINELLNSIIEPSQSSYDLSKSPLSSPRPIPVFMTPSTKGGIHYNNGNSTSASKIVRSKKARRLHQSSLKFTNYYERERPQHSERLTKDQFCKFLNLVRHDDDSLKKYRERISNSEMKFKLNYKDRPVRLRRIHGDMARMPASASYKATRKVGLI